MTHLGIVALALALLIAPIAAQAQQAGKVYSIGYLGLGSSFEEPNRTAFYRGLQAYRRALGKQGDILVITPDGEFFKYLKDPGP